jgi:hypothetical protein
VRDKCLCANLTIYLIDLYVAEGGLSCRESVQISINCATSIFGEIRVSIANVKVECTTTCSSNSGLPHSVRDSRRSSFKGLRKICLEIYGSWKGKSDDSYQIC